MRAWLTAARHSLPAHPSQRHLSHHAIVKLPAFQHIHPCVRDFAAELSQTQPCFQVRSQDIKILSQPKDFLDLLMDMIRRARNRIFLSSLYIGSAEGYIIDALDNSLRQNLRLHVYLHLDYNRSTRPGPTSTAAMLIPLLERYPDRVHAYFFKSPKLKGLMEKIMPRRFDEGWGTWHAKVYGVDEEVMISGSNLNQSYFTDRQDRYLHFKSRSLSQYCYDFLQEMVPFSFRLQLRGSDYKLTWPSPSLHPQKIEKGAGRALQMFQDRRWESSYEDLNHSNDGTNSVLIFPMIQAGQFNIREEERSLALLFKYLKSQQSDSRALVDFTSGYFSLSEAYQRHIQNSTTDCRVLCASPEANGFLGSRGISSRIPEGYTYFEQRFWRGIVEAKRQWNGREGVQFHEWVRKGWTYHAKGLWVSPYIHTDHGTDHGGKAGDVDAPVLTVVGSTNFNSRSANLDTELAFVMIAPSEHHREGDTTMALRSGLRKEVDGLWRNAVPWRGDERRVRYGTKALAQVVGGML